MFGEDILEENFCKLWGIYVRPPGDEMGHFGESIHYHQYRIETPSETGNHSIKFMEMDDQGLSGIGRKCSGP